MTAPQALMTVTLDEYVKRFRERYRGDTEFQESVHKHLNLTKGQRRNLRILKQLPTLLPGMYHRATDAHVRTYAADVYKQVMEKQAMYADLASNGDLADQVASVQQEQRELANITATEKQEQQQTTIEQQQKVIELERQKKEELEKARAALEAQKQEAIRQNDVRAAVAQHIKDAAAQSGLVVTDTTGRLHFDRKKIVVGLENMILDNIVYAIESKEGGGFMSKLGGMFEETGESETKFRLIDDISEMVDMDIESSMYESSMHGFNTITYPYIIVRQEIPVRKSLGRIGVDSVTMVDSSGSMDANNRMRVAQEVGLAVNGMMRRLSAKNTSLLATFSDHAIHEQDAETFARYQIAPNGGTPTDAALRWSLERLARSNKPSIVNLVSDGEPNEPDNAIIAAREYQKYPNIRLCIYLIDPNPKSRDIMRQVGRAAGPDTKYVPIPVEQLGVNIIKGIAESIGKIYSNQNF